MRSRSLAGTRYLLTVAGCTVVLVAGGMSWVQGQGRGGGRGNAGPAIFTVVDANKDGAVTRDEMRSTFEKWFTEWDTAKTGFLTQEQLLAGLNAAAASAGTAGRRRSRRGTEPDARSGARHGHAGCAASHGARQAEATPQGARPRQGRRLRALVDSARRTDDRGDGQEDRRVDYDDHVRPG